MNAEKLQLPITELNVRKPLTASPDESVRAVVAKMREYSGGSVVIVDENGAPIGIFTDRDALTRLFLQGNETLDQPISNVMTRRPRTLHEDDSIVFALHHMHVGEYRHIPLVDEEGKAASIVSVRSVVDYLAKRLEAQDMGEADEQR